MAVIQMPLDPLLRSQHSRRHFRRRERRPTTPTKVLVLADDPGIHLTVRRALQAAGVEVRSDNDSAFSTPSGSMPEGRADLIVAESHTVPWESLRAATGRGSDGTPPVVVVFSDKDDPEQIEKLLEAGVACCLSKSLPPELLERELRRLAAGLSAGPQDPKEILQHRSEDTPSGEPVIWPFSRGN